MSEIQVRNENADDIRAIDVVHLSAFQGDEEVGLIDSLRDSSGFVADLSLVAEFNGRIVGHILLTRIHFLQGKEKKNILALAPMAVVPSQSHRGIGSDLVQASIDKAKALNHTAIVVIGYPDFYRRFGFRLAKEFGLETNISVSNDLVTVLELQEGALAGGGTVIYPSLFKCVY
jgi:putative acetyltransferase